MIEATELSLTGPRILFTQCIYPGGSRWIHACLECNALLYFIYSELLAYNGHALFLQLAKLKCRRLRGDMIEDFFKIIKHKYDYKVAPELIYNINKVTTGNDFRLSKYRSH